jgi:hypothetical protein
MLAMSQGSFSRRQGYTGQAQEITVREDAPESLRFFVLNKAEELGLRPESFRNITCSVLEERPDPSNWSAYPNIWGEVQGHVYHCAWYQVYDIIEAVWRHFREQDEENVFEKSRKAPEFTEALNDFFIRKGIGWQLVDGAIVTRGAEAFEETVTAARRTLEEGGRPTASKHIHEALQDLSRRPAPDLPGAIFHAMGCLECVARDIIGDEKATLGEILKKQKGLVPPPLDAALEKAWGYASNEARHVVEGREPKREEAELLVGLASTVATYLSKKFDKTDEF